MLKNHLISLQEIWKKVHNKVSSVAKPLEMDHHHALNGIRRNIVDLIAYTYRINVLYKSIDSLFVGIATKYQLVKASKDHGNSKIRG